MTNRDHFFLKTSPVKGFTKVIEQARTYRQPFYEAMCLQIMARYYHDGQQYEHDAEGQHQSILDGHLHLCLPVDIKVRRFPNHRRRLQAWLW